MTPRERVNAAVRRQPVDRVPCEMAFTPTITRLAREKLGPNASPAEYFGWATREVGFRGPREAVDFSEYYHGLKGMYIDHDYGTGEVAGEFHHFTKKVFPLEDVRSIAGLEEYPWPDFSDPRRHEHLEDEVKFYQEQGYHVSAFAGHIWETAWQLLGYERALADLAGDPSLVHYTLERITEHNCFKARRMAESGIDMLRVGDDVGMQDRMVMKPDIWREHLKPLLAKVIATAREVSPDLPVWYHSDGAIQPIIPDLIEVGVTVLNPVQPECMDLAEIASAYGDKLAFWGTIGTQQVMPWGTPDDVRAAVKRSIDLMAPGLVLAPTHVVEPEVPWDNIIAFHDAIDLYGVFKL